MQFLLPTTAFSISSWPVPCRRPTIPVRLRCSQCGCANRVSLSTLAKLSLGRPCAIAILLRRAVLPASVCILTGFCAALATISVVTHFPSPSRGNYFTNHFFTSHPYSSTSLPTPTLSTPSIQRTNKRLGVSGFMHRYCVANPPQL